MSTNEIMLNDVPVGAEFTYNGEVYVRTNDERVSCCTVYNSVKKSTNEKFALVPAEKVVVVNNEA